MSKSQYKSSRESIHSEYQSAAEACEPLKANAKDICMAEAKGKKKVSLAELTASYKPTSKSRYGVRIARAEADYAVAKEKCATLEAGAKDSCVADAKTHYGKS